MVMLAATVDSIEIPAECNGRPSGGVTATSTADAAIKLNEWMALVELYLRLNKRDN